MPVCVTCTRAAPYLHTVYKTRSNIRLAVCDNCQSFVDPLIEHPPIILLLDLVLLKPRVFLHLLYNKGHEPFFADSSATASASNLTGSSKSSIQSSPVFATQQNQSGLDATRRSDLFRVGAAAVAAETVIRLCRYADTTQLDMEPLTVLFVLMSATSEIGAQLLTSSMLALAILYIRGWWPTTLRTNVADGRQIHFRPIVLPLTLLYTSILPLLLHAILQIWYNPPTISASASISDSSVSPVPVYLAETLLKNGYIGSNTLSRLADIVRELQNIWATSDKIWTGTRLLAGMSAGFGLRVVLPLRPWEVSGVVLLGWAAAAALGAWTETWVV